VSSPSMTLLCSLTGRELEDLIIQSMKASIMSLDLLLGMGYRLGVLGYVVEVLG
jgi:hypothetical protein